MADQLSPANQVMIAVAYVYQEHGGEPPARAVAAAALRAAADQLAQTPIVIGEPLRGNIAKDAAVIHVADLLAIATELENHQ